MAQYTVKIALTDVNGVLELQVTANENLSVYEDDTIVYEASWPSDFPNMVNCALNFSQSSVNPFVKQYNPHAPAGKTVPGRGDITLFTLRRTNSTSAALSEALAISQAAELKHNETYDITLAASFSTDPQIVVDKDPN